MKTIKLTAKHVSILAEMMKRAIQGEEFRLVKVSHKSDKRKMIDKKSDYIRILKQLGEPNET